MIIIEQKIRSYSIADEDLNEVLELKMRTMFDDLDCKCYRLRLWVLNKKAIN